MKRIVSLFLMAALLLAVVGTVSAEGKTIVYWSMWEAAEPQGQVIQKAVDAYMAETGNKVDLQFKGRTGMREGLQPALDAGTVIDLFDEDIDRVNFQWGTYLLDLEELAKAADYEATANAGLMAVARANGGGTLKSIPYQPFIFNYFYNVDLFEDAGVTEAPATWEAFMEACQKLKDKGYIPVTSDDAYVLLTMGYHLARLVGEEQVDKIVKEGLWAEEPAVLKAAQDFEEMAKKGFFSPTIASSAFPANQNGELALGEAAMYLNGSWLPNEVKAMTGPDFNWGCFPYPELEGGVTGLNHANFGGQVYGINAKTEVAQEAFDIILKVTKGEFDSQLSQESMGVPSDTNNSQWPDSLKNVKPVYDAITKAYESDPAIRFSWGAGIENNPDMTPIIKQEVQKLFFGAITAEEFVNNLETASSK